MKFLYQQLSPGNTLLEMLPWGLAQYKMVDCIRVFHLPTIALEHD